MRTIKRHSRPLNKGKHNTLTAVASAYAAEKQKWLAHFQRTENVHLIKHHRTVRNDLIKSSYISPHGLQARMWKLALIDAAETMDKYWQAFFVDMKKLVFRNIILSPDQKHYCFRMLKDYRMMQDILRHKYPPFKGLGSDERKKVANYLYRIIRRGRGAYPEVKKVRSFVLDPECYSLFEEKGSQYINIMTLKCRKRVTVPLTGSTPITGNIRIVLAGPDSVSVHYTADIKASKPIPETIEAIDFGYTEVATDTQGYQYGKGFGKIMSVASDALKTKMQRRHKLHSLQKKLAESDCAADRKKASHIAKMNLGRKKFDRSNRKAKATITREINTGLNKLFGTRRPSVIITEDLSHVFSFNRSNSWNRRLSAWTKGVLQERVTFKALAGGSRHKQVNPAYGSQTCVVCGFVEAKNRSGDRFKCLNCRHEDHADKVAAMNYLARYYDPEITRYMPYRKVKIILQERFRRRLESSKEGTVPGRTLDTVNLATSTADRKKTTSLLPGGQSKSETKNLCPHLGT